MTASSPDWASFLRYNRQPIKSYGDFMKSVHNHLFAPPSEIFDCLINAIECCEGVVAPKSGSAECGDIPMQSEEKKRTVRVRIAVSVDRDGFWRSAGAEGMPDHTALDLASATYGDAIYWLTAELPIPEMGDVVATVERA